VRGSSGYVAAGAMFAMKLHEAIEVAGTIVFIIRFLHDAPVSSARSQGALCDLKAKID
jgi:hypothetical protein